MAALHHLSNADLHSHSTRSDGTLEPAALATRAHAAGVELWALTDHDTLAGQAEARSAALDLGLAYLSGVEVSASFAGRSVHVLGLGVDADDPDLGAGLAQIRHGRGERARRIADDLARVGLQGAYEGALAHAGDPALIARTHFARWLVERGVVADSHAAFRHYLVEGKPGHVPHRWATLAEALRWIGAAGGLAVLAHPGRYGFTATEEWALFDSFQRLGGRAVEVMVGAHNEAERVAYGKLAQEFELLASRGSDFHDPSDSRTDLGALPDLPGRLQPVWLALQGRIQHG